jgi:hypothetical protein
MRLTSWTTTNSFMTVTPSIQGVFDPIAPIVWACSFDSVPKGSGVEVETAYSIPTGWLKVSCGASCLEDSSNDRVRG